MRITPYTLVTMAASLAVFLAMLSIVWRSVRNGISPMPASGAVRRAAARELARLPAIREDGVQAGIVVEAGSGWGGLAYALVEHAGGRRIVGVENSMLPLLASRLGLWFWYKRQARHANRGSMHRGQGSSGSSPNAAPESVGTAFNAAPESSRTASAPVQRSEAPLAFVRGDLYAYPYEEVDVVVCYLYPGAMRRLDPLLKAKLQPGAAVISLCFALPGWTPVRTVVCGDLYRTKVYVYQVDHVEG